MAEFRTLDDLDVAGKRVLVRADLNVPMQDGQVSDRTRLERLGPTIRDLSGNGAKVILLSHFGRPKGRIDPALSLRPVAAALGDCLGDLAVGFVDSCVGPEAAAAVAALADGEVLVLENLRFHAAEEQNDGDFAAALAALGDIYVNDAFSAAHRAHASTDALARLLPAAAGRLMAEELGALDAALSDPKRPVMAIVGGAKIATKLELLGNMVARVDILVIGGGMANTFLNAAGHGVGRSLCEHELAATARDIMDRAKTAGCDLVLPVDAVVAAALEPGIETRVVGIDGVPAEQMILDVGPASVKDILDRLGRCQTLMWNGPLGVFEVPPFDGGTNEVAQQVGAWSQEGRLMAVAGGGDTVAALRHAGVLGQLSYVSSAGGAFLEWLEGKTLPGVAALGGKR
ncbi:MAG: phosphoglycerate kinase [Alphaproteobacteria bacterium]